MTGPRWHQKQAIRHAHHLFRELVPIADMSGIVGVVSLDGGPVDQALLRRMTDALVTRGPDEQWIWSEGPVGLGHALLATTGEPEHRQPASLDGYAWITADARIDGRTDLVAQLESRGRRDLRSASDAQLILHAYLSWGEDCVEHLLGDFAFAIWDERSRSLFCARDHFGVKPFYYARVPNGFVFSNSLNCVRLHPGVGDTLNELAVSDFLLFWWNRNAATTVFADVQRLAPAHRLTCGSGPLCPARYWTLPANGRVRYRRSRDYVDHFRQLLDEAVSDRLPGRRVGVWMSGGLDSTSIAATAQRVLARSGNPFEVRAHTVVYDTLIPDEERRFARIAAEALGVETSFLVADAHGPLEGWDQTDLPMPEPTDDPFLRLRSRLLRQAASHSRVILSGEGADELLWGSYVVDLLRGGMPPIELAADIVRSIVVHRRRPAAGFRYALQKRFRPGPTQPTYPPWVDRDFTERLDLRARWAQVHGADSRGPHALRPEAYGRLAHSVWSWYCEASDPGVTGIPIEARHPFLDVRLVRYALAIPPLPWCIGKQILREAMRGTLPETIRLRPKAPLAGDPLRVKFRESGAASLDGFDAASELGRFVNRNAIPPIAGSDDPWLHVRPLCLNAWLRRLHPTRLEEAILR